jgi:hypothetical protein
MLLQFSLTIEGATEKVYKFYATIT